MAQTIEKRVSSLLHKPIITGADAYTLIEKVENDDRVAKSELRGLAKIAALPDDRFEKRNGSVVSAVDDLRSQSEWAKELLDCKLTVKSNVRGVTVGFENVVRVEKSEYGNNYHRILTVQMKGKKASQDGRLTFQYGGFTVSVKVRKGMSAQSLFNALESRVVRQQNGAMTVVGTYESDRIMNPSVGFGIHRVAPMTKIERLEFTKRELEMDLMELRMEGDPPQALTKPIEVEIAKIEKQIAALQKKK